MNKAKGPFQIIEAEADSGELSREFRNYDCDNYQCCLGLAAGLDWEDFSCRNCVGEIDQTLYWQVRQVQKKDNLVQTICELPEVPCIDGGEDDSETGELQLMPSGKNAVK